MIRLAIVVAAVLLAVTSARIGNCFLRHGGREAWRSKLLGRRRRAALMPFGLNRK